jgi:hypothetical protein
VSYAAAPRAFSLKETDVLLSEIDKWIGRCSTPELLLQVEKWCRERREKLAQKQEAGGRDADPNVSTKDVYRPVEGGA